MKISELKAKQGKVELTGEITEMTPAREFSKFGSGGRVANAMLKDDSGTIKISLWNEQIDKVDVGDKIEIKNGYVSEYQGELQLSTGKFGSLEVLDKKVKAEKAKVDPNEDYSDEDLDGPDVEEEDIE